MEPRSRMKWNSISRWWDRMWKMVASKLSHDNVGDCSSRNLISISKDFNQSNLLVAIAIARYSNFMEDRETACCLWDLHDIKFGPRKMLKPVVDFLSTLLPPESASQCTCRLKSLLWWIYKPKLILPERYQSMRWTWVQRIYSGAAYFEWLC